MGEMIVMVILFTLFWAASAQINGPRVVTNTGTFIGRDEIVPGQRRPIYSFRGIKYAEVRGRFFYSKYFEASRLDTRNAISDGLPCPQPFMRPSDYSEDCLHLSVWSPSISTSSRKLPVLIYLTGSLWTLDRPDMRRLAPESLVSERNILVVTVSYRLNVFGFLSLEHSQVPGNMGLLDIYFALLWVRKNIQYFGGNPSRLTLAGSGSGGTAALYLSLSARSSSLVSRVISVSGSLTTAWASSRDAKVNAKRFIERVNCYPPEVRQCLQKKSTQEILSALEDHLANGNITNIFAPVADTFLDSNDRFLGDPLEKLKRGDIDRRISYMFGENEEDGAEILYFLRRTLDKFRSARELKYFIDNTMLPVSLQKYDPLVRSPFIQQLLAFQYFTNSGSERFEETASLLESLQIYLTDSYYSSPMRETLDLMVDARAKVYSFVNSYKDIAQSSSPLVRPTSRPISLTTLLFGPSQFDLQTDSGPRGVDRAFRAASTNVQDAIVPFIEGGEPQADLRWPRYKGQSHDYIEINTLRSRRGYKDKNATFWLELLPRLSSILEDEATAPPVPDEATSETEVYSTLTWLLLATVLLLLVLLAVSWVLGRRRQRTESVFTLGSGLGGSSCIETRGPRPGSGPRGRWRETLTSNRM